MYSVVAKHFCVFIIEILLWYTWSRMSCIKAANKMLVFDPEGQRVF